MLILIRGRLILISGQLFLSSGKRNGLQGNVMHSLQMCHYKQDTAEPQRRVCIWENYGHWSFLLQLKGVLNCGVIVWYLETNLIFETIALEQSDSYWSNNIIWVSNFLFMWYYDQMLDEWFYQQPCVNGVIIYF